MPPERIISLIASATEIVSALGLQDRLVGRSHECDFPPSVRRLPVCTEPRFPVRGDSRQIDRAVKAVLEDALAVYRVDVERLRELRPDVIVTQTQCEVCAVSLTEVEAALATDLLVKPRLVALQPDALADVWEDFRRVAAATGTKERCEVLLESLRRRMRAIRDVTGSLPTRPRVACIEWIEPPMAAGNWMPELVEMAGGENLFGEAGIHSPWLDWTTLLAADPEVVVVLPCGFDIERSREDMHFLTRRPGWDRLQAARSGRIYLADGNQFFNRPGPRLVESLEILAEMLHPEIFDFGHRGYAWQVA